MKTKDRRSKTYESETAATDRTKAESALDSSSTRKGSLVREELADLQALRKESGHHRQFRETTSNVYEHVRYHVEIVRRRPQIAFCTLLVLGMLCAGSLSIVFVMARNDDVANERDAFDLAAETGEWFSDQLDKATLPLFSLAQFVGEIDTFDSLAEQVAVMPQVISDDGQINPAYRNTSGVCDNEGVVQRFNKIAKSIKENADMKGVLFNLQIVPDEVVCMIYPLVNTEDFEEGIVLDNTGAIGLDLLGLPTRVTYVESVLESSGIYMAGPLTLEGEGQYSTIVEKAFIAALPVRSNSHTIESRGTTYRMWGSVEGLINWNVLIERSNVFERFESDGKGFKLIRSDTVVDAATGEESTSIVVLAETDNFENRNFVHVSVLLDTIDDMWEMIVAYEQESDAWLPYAIAAAVLLSIFIAMLVFVVLAQKEGFNMMQKRYLEDLAQPQKMRLRMFLDVQGNDEPTEEMEKQILNGRPIADFFPACTVMIADINGFSSWASQREPSQVFKLLQTIFFHFDKISRKRGVFKVETTGDAYVVVAGIPEEQPDHAIRMCKFAQECLFKFNFLTRELEKQLGPETADLKMRIGLASGPVVGGVLLGGDSKFHIVGPTVRSAGIMESTAEADSIHLSEKTADLLVESGRKKWVQARKEKVLIKGFGEMQTYCITKRKKDMESSGNHSSFHDNASYCSDLSAGSGELWSEDQNLMFLPSIQIEAGDQHKDQRLIDWQVESLLGLIRKIIAYRNQGKKNKRPSKFPLELKKGETVLDEVQEIIALPEFDSKKATVLSSDLSSIVLSRAVESQVRSLVQRVADMYHDNPFHNFQHANHVTMAVHKLLNRIVSPEDVNYERMNRKRVAQSLHDYTFGITSDPLTHLAVVFSALVHDVDHRGVSNPQLSKEIPELGEKYKFQSVAEQNSVDLAWDLLMQPEFSDLHETLFATPDDYTRFRQLIVNAVMATDIFDPELKALRNMRWDRAFHADEFQRDYDISSVGDVSTGSSSKDSLEPVNNSDSRGGEGQTNLSESALRLLRKQTATNRKATIVIEHIVQASDVAHTMQHWNVYKRWNERLFQEMYVAYKTGRSAKSPAEGWYKGELWFFDNYVIPLAKKLDECGVFGVASDECLFNAIENRREWALKGERVVAEMLANCQRMDIKLASVAEDTEEKEVP